MGEINPSFGIDSSERALPVQEQREYLSMQVHDNLDAMKATHMASLALDPETGKRLFDVETSAMLGKMATAAALRDSAWTSSGLKDRILAMESSYPALADILQALTTAPEQDLSVPPNHPYLRSRLIAASEDKDAWHFPTLRVAIIQEHRTLLASILSDPSLVSLHGDVQQMDAALSELQALSPMRSAVAQIEQKLANNPTDKAIWKMLGIAGFLAATIMGGASAISSVASGQFPTGAALLFSTAALIGNKDLRDSLVNNFVSEKWQANVDDTKKMLEQSDAVLNNDDFNNICLHNDLQGRQAKELCEALMDAEPDVHAALKRIAALQPEPEDAEMIVQYLSNTNPSLETMVRKMLANGSLPILDKKLQALQDEHAKNLALSYIEEGSWKYKFTHDATLAGEAVDIGDTIVSRS